MALIRGHFNERDLIREFRLWRCEKCSRTFHQGQKKWGCPYCMPPKVDMKKVKKRGAPKERTEEKVGSTSSIHSTVSNTVTSIIGMSAEAIADVILRKSGRAGINSIGDKGKLIRRKR